MTTRGLVEETQGLASATGAFGSAASRAVLPVLAFVGVTNLMSGALGSATAGGHAASASMWRIQNSMQSVTDAIGRVVSRGLDLLSPAIETAADWFTRADEATNGWSTGLLLAGGVAFGFRGQIVGITRAVITGGSRILDMAGNLIPLNRNLAQTSTRASAARSGLASLGRVAGTAAGGIGVATAALLAAAAAAGVAEEAYHTFNVLTGRTSREDNQARIRRGEGFIGGINQRVGDALGIEDINQKLYDAPNQVKSFFGGVFGNNQQPTQVTVNQNISGPIIGNDGAEMIRSVTQDAINTGTVDIPGLR